MTSDRDLLRRALVAPQTLASLTLKEWDVLIRQARHAGVLGRIQAVLEQADLLQCVPSQPMAHLTAAAAVARGQEEVVKWEVHCIERALRGITTDVILLKGAAYVLSRMELGRGRLQTDVDILVPKAKLNAVEAALIEHGWVGMKLDEYDQRYYREWSHELPPLIHSQRQMVLDVHHNILPETGRLHPDPAKLIEAAQPVSGTPYKRLCPQDMVLHTAAHMFQDGDLKRGLRELADLDGLFRAFAARANFWKDLICRATEMDLERPAFYALRYAHRYFETPIPSEVFASSRMWASPRPILQLMDRLVSAALDPNYGARFGSGLARWVLYARSHWLRMPPAQLVRHLTHQSVRSAFPK
jgi:hypothetical protein